MKKKIFASIALLALLTACDDHYDDQFNINPGITDVKDIAMTLATRQRHRVRPPHAPARRAGHGHVLRRPVLQLAAGKQREQERHDPPVSAQTQRDPDGHGRGTAGDCRRGQQPSHARAGLPDARRGIRRRTARIAGPTGVLHL